MLQLSSPASGPDSSWLSPRTASAPSEPRNYRGWLFPRDPTFVAKASVILELYQRRWQDQALGPHDYVLSADEKLPDDDLKDLYDPDKGRPSLPPSLMSGALLLQFHDDVSDQEAAERILYDLRWKVALHLPLDYAGFDGSSLSRYRTGWWKAVKSAMPSTASWPSGGRRASFRTK